VLTKALRARIDARAMGEHDVQKEGLLAALSARAGEISREQLDAERERLIGYQKADDARRGGDISPFLTWIAVYARDIENESDASAALAALSRLGGPVPEYVRSVQYIPQLGATYAFAGRGTDAIPLLKRVQRSCSELHDVITHTHGWYALGLAREQAGDTAGACVAYQKVLDRWGVPKPPSITADGARRRMRR
jgi:predicted Zn-dependent protease